MFASRKHSLYTLQIYDISCRFLFFTYKKNIHNTVKTNKIMLKSFFQESYFILENGFIWIIFIIFAKDTCLHRNGKKRDIEELI